MTSRIVALTAAGLMLSTGAALAQSPAGNPADPSTYENRQPGPSPTQPSDPAAGSSEAARLPTSPPGTGDGVAVEASEPDSMSSSGAAGFPADPSTYENRQPGPAPTQPTDPAAGSKKSARVPTSPPGTGPYAE
jgi:hypothetical protein